MKSQFIEQIQLLMEIQHINYTECYFGKPNNYMWLSSKKPHTVYWMSTNDEIKLRNLLSKITERQEIVVLKRLLSYLDDNPNISPSKIPEITLEYLQECINCKYFPTEIKPTTLTRLGSIRNSFKKLKLSFPKDRNKLVKFNEIPTIYRDISK